MDWWQVLALCVVIAVGATGIVQTIWNASEAIVDAIRELHPPSEDDSGTRRQFMSGGRQCLRLIGQCSGLFWVPS